MKNNVIKIKKYLFLISILFFVSIGGHLVYTFLYHDAEVVAVPGGTISEGIIGPFPELNPLKKSSGNNRYMIDLLYRSLLTYDIQNNKIESDIANCDISSVSYIECYFNNDLVWSDGSSLTTEDILATYKILQETDINPVMNSLLSEATITAKNNILVFENKQSDVNFINIFFQPIVAKSVLENLSDSSLRGKFNTIDSIYSGKFLLSSVSQDTTIGITRFVMSKNQAYPANDILIDQLILKLFPDSQTFLNNKDTVNIFHDERNILGSSVPRFEQYKYTLPQYLGVFINKDSIENESLRENILSNINRSDLIDILGKDLFSSVYTPYLGEGKDESDETKDSKGEILRFANSQGFFSPTQQISALKGNKNPKNIISNEVTVSDKSDENLGISFEDIQINSSLIISPEYIDKYNFVSKDDILLTGKVETQSGSIVDAVYVNDYKLQGYTPGDDVFNYRLKETFSNITTGENSYTIYFEVDGTKQEMETIYLLYYSNISQLGEQKQIYIESLVSKEEDRIRQAIIDKQKDIQLSENIDEKIAQLHTLDPDLLYNSDGEIFGFSLMYLNSDDHISKSALFIKNTLKKQGIDITLLPVGQRQLGTIVNNKNSYDMILMGINLGYFDHNIFQYFHSGQAQVGYNFSQLKKTSLDLLLEELKSSILGFEQKIALQDKVVEIIQSENVFKALYTPNIHMLIDKKIAGVEFSSTLPYKYLRSEILENISIQNKKNIQNNQKGIGKFLQYIFTRLYE